MTLRTPVLFVTLAAGFCILSGGSRALPRLESDLTAGLSSSGSDQVKSGTDESRNASRKGAITGRVVGESGQGLVGIQVYAWTAGMKETRGYADSSDDDGRFRVARLPSGSYRLYTYAAGYVEEPGTTRPEFYRPGDSATIHMI